MNYLKQIKAFYDQLEINTLGTPAIALWHALMHICNKTGWRKEFTVAVSVLSLKSGLKERTVYEARNELKTKGYITFKSRGGNKSSTYSITCLYAFSADSSADNSEDTDTEEVLPALHADSFTGNDVDSSADSSAGNPAALFKHKQDLNQNQTSGSSVDAKNNPFTLFEAEGFGTLSPLIADRINDLIDFYSEKWVVEAMKEAVFAGKRSVRYFEGILKRWKAEGIDSKRSEKKDEHSESTEPFADIKLYK